LEGIRYSIGGIIWKRFSPSVSCAPFCLGGIRVAGTNEDGQDGLPAAEARTGFLLSPPPNPGGGVVGRLKNRGHK